MTDKVSKEKRSEIMSKVKSKDTKVEIKARHWLFKHGLRYRKNCKDIVGRPDIAIKKYKIAIFIHGCFWHGHENCKNFRLPSDHGDYWRKKIQANIDRDSRNAESLKKSGWKVFVIWECQLKKDIDSTMEILLLEIRAIKKKFDSKSQGATT